MMDYFLSSRELERPDGQADYSEKLVLLPGLGIDYQRPQLADNAKGRSQLGLPLDSTFMLVHKRYSNSIRTLTKCLRLFARRSIGGDRIVGRTFTGMDTSV